MNKFEKLIEYIINDEDQKARELFHSIVVEKSRDIYESIMDEESMEETVHGGQVEDLTHEIQDEEAMGEDEEFDLGGDMDDDGDLDGGLPADDDFGPADDDTAEHNEIENKVMDIDAKLDELLAKFDDIMGGDDDFGSSGTSGDSGLDGDFETDNEPEEEPEDAIAEAKGSGNPFAKGSGQSGSGSAASGKSGSAASGKSGSGKMESRRMSTTELMREYVDKIQDMNLTGASEGDAVGAAGKKTAVNTKPGSVGPGADFGGETIKSKGGEQNQDGTSPTKASNEYNKGQGEIKSGNRNVPGGKAGAPESTGHEYTKDAKGAEGQTTSGSVPVNDKSVQKQNTGKK